LEEVKRVGAVRGMETEAEGNWRKVAVARLRSTEDAAEASSLVVGIHGVSDAIEFRKSKRGSCSAILLVANADVDMKRRG
jgi:hypothetical protein